MGRLQRNANEEYTNLVYKICNEKYYGLYVPQLICEISKDSYNLNMPKDITKIITTYIDMQDNTFIDIFIYNCENYILTQKFGNQSKGFKLAYWHNILMQFFLILGSSHASYRFLTSYSSQTIPILSQFMPSFIANVFSKVSHKQKKKNENTTTKQCHCFHSFWPFFL